MKNKKEIKMFQNPGCSFFEHPNITRNASENSECDIKIFSKLFKEIEILKVWTKMRFWKVVQGYLAKTFIFSSSDINLCTLGYIRVSWGKWRQFKPKELKKNWRPAVLSTSFPPGILVERIKLNNDVIEFLLFIRHVFHLSAKHVLAI